MPPTRKKSADRTKPATSEPNRMWGALLRVWHPAVLLPVSLTLAGLVTGPWIIRWLPHLQQRPEFAVSSGQLQLPPANRWVPSDLPERIWKESGLSPSESRLEPTLPQRVAETLAANPWIKSVQEVRSLRDGTVVASLEYREPVLLLETLHGLYPVDENSVLLPPGDFAGQDLSLLPLARGIRSLPQGPAGRKWDDPIIEGAIALAQLLQAKGDDDTPSLWQQLRLGAIQLPNSPVARPELHDLTYELVTINGSRIIWGHPPGAETLEPPPDQKLARLRYYVERHGGFEATDAPARIDIRPLEVIFAEPLLSRPR